MKPIDMLKHDRQETDKRITDKYTQSSDHNPIIATRFHLLFKRRVDSSTLQRNGLVCGFLPSVKKSYPHLKDHLETVIQMGKQGVEAIFDKVIRNKRGALTTINSTTRFMATLGTSNNPMEGRISMEAKLVALYRTDIFTKKDFYFSLLFYLKTHEGARDHYR